MRAKDITEIALIIVGVIVLILIILTLSGCVIGTRGDLQDDGYFSVDADCEKQRVKVELDLDRNDTTREIRVTK